MFFRVPQAIIRRRFFLPSLVATPPDPTLDDPPADRVFLATWTRAFAAEADTTAFTAVPVTTTFNAT